MTVPLSSLQQKKRLKFTLLLFFALLLLPLGILAAKIYSQLKLESYLTLLEGSQELVRRVETRLRDVIKVEEERQIGDYSYFSSGSAQDERFRSPLSYIPPQTSVPGIISYFEITSDGKVKLPSSMDETGQKSGSVVQADKGDSLKLQAGIISDLKAISAPARRSELKNKKDIAKEKMEGIAEGREREIAAKDISATEESLPQPEQRQQEVAAGTLSHLNIDSSQFEQQGKQLLEKARSKNAEFADKSAGVGGRIFASNNIKREVEKQYRDRIDAQGYPATNNPLSESRANESDMPQVPPAAFPGPIIEQDLLSRLETTSEVEPFRAKRTSSGRLVFTRNVYQGGQRSQQGFVVEEKTFLEPIFKSVMSESAIGTDISLIFSYSGTIINRINPNPAESLYDRKTKILSLSDSLKQEKNDTLIYRSFLDQPLENYELLFVTQQIGIGPGGRLVNILILVSVGILLLGMLGLYKIGARQIDLAKSRSDFVSAVSHELKTPLTSIRMYGEMLREGWVSDDSKRRSYYDFIFQESERLSRLISNVLQLSKLSNGIEEMKSCEEPVASIFDQIVSKTSSQISAAGFSLVKSPDTEPKNPILHHIPDFTAQIFINLVDNALKFSTKAERKEIELGYRILKDGVEFFVRDFGPGIPKNQLKKIFELFYRGHDELTRETPGTGIGLALVSELAAKMNAKIDALNRDPGAEFIVRFP